MLDVASHSSSISDWGGSVPSRGPPFIAAEYRMSTPTVHRSDPTVLRVIVFEKVKHMHENATRKVRILEIARQR